MLWGQSWRCGLCQDRDQIVPAQFLGPLQRFQKLVRCDRSWADSRIPVKRPILGTGVLDVQFRGHLLLPGDNGPGLSVNLDVAEHHLAVESDGGGLGAWPLEVVDVARLEGDIFALTVAGEPLRFVADDTIAFAYSGVPTIERISPRLRPRFGLRSFLGRIWSAPVESVETAADSPERRALSDSPESSEASAMKTKPAPVQHAVEKPAPVPEPVETPAEATEGAVEESGNPPISIPLVDTKVEEPASVDEVTETRCPAIRSDGRRCESPILTSSGYCYPHDPRRAFDDKYQAAQDAREQIKREATGRLNRIYGRLEKAMRQVERGELDPETAMAMAQLARTMCAILDVEPPPPATDHR
jgi:hypothetical protein